MKKIISLFKRDYENGRLVINEVTPGAEWVIAGEGIATQKFDGTCCMVRDGQLFKRYDAKKGKTPSVEFEPAQDPDPITGHWPGWLPVSDSNEDKYFREAILPDSPYNCGLLDGTYELCGPKIQNNPERLQSHSLIKHGKVELSDCPRTFEELKTYFRVNCNFIEGVVWHHTDGRMVKLKCKDFGFKRGV